MINENENIGDAYSYVERDDDGKIIRLIIDGQLYPEEIFKLRDLINQLCEELSQ